MSDYKEDLKICKGATQGPWRFYKINEDSQLITMRRIDDSMNRALLMTPASDCDNNYEFIAHFDPPKVTELLTDLQAKDEEIAAFRAVLEGAEYQLIDNIKSLTKEECLLIGRDVATRTKEFVSSGQTKDKRIEELKEALGDAMEEYSIPMSDYYKGLLKC